MSDEDVEEVKKRIRSVIEKYQK